MIQSHFFDTPEKYQRDFRIKKGYIEQTAHFVAAQTHTPYEEAVELVKDLVAPGQEKGFIDPRVMVLERQKNGDRIQKTETFDQMMSHAVREQHVMSPSMVFYTSPDKERSLLSLYTATLVKRRSKIKGLQHDAKVAGDTVMENFHKQGQTSVKIAVNSISGATCNPHNAFYNPSAHTTLTSTCRITTAYANANNERLIAGSRHYWNPEIAMNNIASIVTRSNYDNIAKAMKKHNLKVPTVQETMDCVLRSSRCYWENPVWEQRILNYIEGLNDLERAAFVYTGDLHQLALLNEDMWREFLDRMITIPTDNSAGEDFSIMSQMDGDLQSLIGILNQDILRGTSLKDVKKENIEGYKTVVATFRGILETFDDYKWLIYAFWKTDNPPCTIAKMPNMLRRAVLGSDTDSSMATAERWVYWYTGKYKFDAVAASIAAVIIYLSSMTLVHILAQFSANLGVSKKQQYQIAMKNEFMYSAYIRTTVAKHYFSNVIACEGNVYTEEELDIKGVQLHAGKAPSDIRKQIKGFQIRALETLAKGELIDMQEELKMFGDIERGIYSSVAKGGSEFLTTIEVKNKESYSQPYRTPYLYHELWEDVFAPKYGASGVLPYYGIKVTMDLPNKTSIQRGIDRMQDRALADRFAKWVNKFGKKDFTYFVVPYDIAMDKGIPEEILGMTDTRGLIKTTLSAAYLSLESLGIYLNNPNNTRLISDYN